MEAAYRRRDLFERRRMMAEWAKFCAVGTLATPRKVVQLRRQN